MYAEAKSEYTKQLCQYLVPSIQQYFLDLLEEAKQKEADPKRILVMFQTLLEDISDWNVDKVQRETTSIITSSECDYLEELMTAVFIAHTKVLSAIRLTTKQKKLQITIPKLEHFIHRILRECSRLLWTNTYLFSTSVPPIERQKNLRTVENFLHEGVLQGIRGMLPVKNILREYLKEDDNDEEDAEDTDEKVEPEAKKKPEEKPKSNSEPVTEVKEKPKLEETETITIDTPISFTGNDTLLEEEMFNDIEEDVDEKNENTETIEIMDAPAEAMDGFEDLEPKQENAIDFETLE